MDCQLFQQRGVVYALGLRPKPFLAWMCLVSLMLGLPGAFGATHTVGSDAFFSSLSPACGNFYTATSDVELMELEAYLDLPAAMTLRFFVYECATQDGTYTKILDHEVTPSSTGEQWYSSGFVYLPLASGTFYYIGVGLSDAGTVFYQTHLGGFTTVLSFAEHSAARTTSYPPPATEDWADFSVSYYQRLTIDEGDLIPGLVSVTPTAGSVLTNTFLSVDVVFSEPVYGVDETDLVFAGQAGTAAVVDPPENLDLVTWRFPISGLISGPLNIGLAPDPDDIEDADGNDLAPQPTLWDYTIDLADYGDAPDPTYPTLKANNGASHGFTAGALVLGTAFDIDLDGQPDGEALGDDLDIEGDDEDGVVFLDPLATGGSANIEVTASAAGFVDAWIDYNSDGDWDDPDEQVLVSQAVVAGTNSLVLAVPATAPISPKTYARFRLSDTGGLSYDGSALNGEVEDYAVEITLGPPLLDPEPEATVGTTNTITWPSLAEADEYLVEYSLAPDFIPPLGDSGWIPGLSHEFVDLLDGELYFYRGMARKLFPGTANSWSQTSQVEFDTDTLAGVTTEAPGHVRLPAGGINGPFVEDTTLVLDEFTRAEKFRGNIFLMSNYSVLKAIEVYINLPGYTDLRYAVYEGGESFGDEYTLVHNETVADVDPAGGPYFSSGAVDVPMDLGKHYIVGAAWDDTVDFYRGDPDVMSFGTQVGHAVIGDYEVPLTLSGAENIVPTLASYALRLTTEEIIPITGPGTVTTAVLSPSPLAYWDRLDFSASLPALTSLVVDVLPATGTEPIPGFADVANGGDLSGIAETEIRLRATLDTQDILATPVLQDWQVDWQEVADDSSDSGWSEAVSSRQDNTPPSILTTDPEEYLNGGSDYIDVTFSEPVTGVEATDLVLGGEAGAAATVEEPIQLAPDVWRFPVSGLLPGTLLASFSGIQDMVGLDLSPDPTNRSFSVFEDDTPPAVDSIVLLDENPTSSPFVRFRVEFTEEMRHVSSADFDLFSPLDQVTGAEILGVMGSGNTYSIALTTGTGNGQLGLKILADGGMTDMAYQPMVLDYYGLSYTMAHMQIVSQPPQTVWALAGRPYTFEVIIEGGTAPFVYQWYREFAGIGWLPLAGGDGPAYTYDYLIEGDSGVYRCEISDRYETISTWQSTLTVAEYIPLAGFAGLSALAGLMAAAGVWRRKGRK